MGLVCAVTDYSAITYSDYNLKNRAEFYKTIFSIFIYKIAHKFNNTCQPLFTTQRTRLSSGKKKVRQLYDITKLIFTKPPKLEKQPALFAV